MVRILFNIRYVYRATSINVQYPLYNTQFLIFKDYPNIRCDMIYAFCVTFSSSCPSSFTVSSYTFALSPTSAVKIRRLYQDLFHSFYLCLTIFYECFLFALSATYFLNSVTEVPTWPFLRPVETTSYLQNLTFLFILGLAPLFRVAAVYFWRHDQF